MSEGSSLVDVARNHLRLPTPTPVPQFYITALKRHLLLCPNEDNFRVTLQPNVGFGTVTCLKNGCNQTISLTKRGFGDGGKADGFGSLSAYRTHVSNHDSLPKVARVKSALKEVVKQRSSNGTSASDIGSTSQTLTSSSSKAKGVPQSAGQVKEKALAGIILRKRLRDPDSVSENGGSVPLSPSARHATKKIKTDLHKNPLSPVTNTNIPLETPGAIADTMSQGTLQHVRTTTSLQSNFLAQSRAAFVEPHNEYHQYNTGVKQEPRHSTSLGYEAQRPMSSTRNINPPAVRGLRPVPQSCPMEIDGPLALPNDIPRGPFIANALTASSSRLGPRPSPLVNGDPPFGSNSAYPPILMAPGTKMDQIPSTQASLSKQPHSMPAVNFPAFMSEDGFFDSEGSDDEDASLFTDILNLIGITPPAPIADNDAIDANGDYYGRGRDLFEGPRASQDDFEKFLIQAGNAEVFDGNERVEDALKHLGLKTLNDRLPGMEVNLMAHQALGVKWMIEKEKSEFKGGCLADEMGLGKTVQMIAMMLKNRPTDPKCKTTLIITPLALLDQWQMEIELKTNCGITCLIYHGPSKTTSKKKLLQYDVVLTTFSTLSHEWPDFETEMKKKKKARKNGEDFVVSDDEEDMKDFAYRSQKRKQKAGLLFQVEFFRIVLDEAQNIRNRRTRISRAVTDIQASYRWCLTGTPIVNTLADAYGYIRFLKIRPWYDWEEFNGRVTRIEKKRPDLAITRLHAIMSTFLLRRQKNTTMDGKPIIDLPDKEVKLVKLEFSKEESDVYKMVEARSQAIFNRYLRAGTVLKNYHHVLVLLLRLRQICSHASLIAEDGDAYIQPDEVDDDFKPEFSTELSRARRLVSEEFVTKMKEKYKQEALQRMKAEKMSADASIEEEDCPICYDAMTDAVLTACSHVFCRECIVNFINTRPAAGVRDADDRGCPCCRGPLDAQKLFSRSAFEPTDRDLNPKSGVDNDGDVDMLSDDDDSYYPGKGKAKAVTRSNRRANRRKARIVSDDDDDDDDMSDFIVQSDEDEEEKDARRAVKQRLTKKRAFVILDSDEEETPEEREVLFGSRKKKADMSPEAIKLLPRFLPSSKMKYMMNEMERISSAKPDEKILVVSQWTSCLALVSNYLTEQGIPHVKYQGDMSRTKRDQAVRVFMSKEKARVMLMSLKCGGVGLNLTRANNVISLDLGWSLAVESQAFDRVHRLGQNRKVLVQRVVISGTVEDRILQLQDRKKTFADGTLGEGSGKKMGKLTVKELANLFGLDARGRVLHD